jgi:hypothetical protein
MCWSTERTASVGMASLVRYAVLMVGSECFLAFHNTCALSVKPPGAAQHDFTLTDLRGLLTQFPWSQP